jgi:hypothetical protein
MDSRLSPRFTLSSFSQFEKAPSLIFITLSGTVISTRLRQLEKVYGAISVILSLSIISSIGERKKAWSAM